jgi:hypothetical protein
MPPPPGRRWFRLPQTFAAREEWSRPGEGFQKASRSRGFSEKWGRLAEAALDCVNVTWPGVRGRALEGRVEMEHGADRRRPDCAGCWLSVPGLRTAY